MNNIDALPEVSACRLLSTGETILVKRGEMGFTPCDIHDAERFND